MISEVQAKKERWSAEEDEQVRWEKRAGRQANQVGNEWRKTGSSSGKCVCTPDTITQETVNLCNNLEA